MIKNIFQRIGNTLNDRTKFPIKIKPLEKKIRYTFQNKNLLIKALKHRSYLSLTREKDFESNERLEFLGDAVLDLIVTEHLYNNYNTQDEGFLSKRKSILVSRHVLGQITDELNLGEYLLINKGEEKTGGRSRRSNLANLFEAVLGAVYLDGGYQSAEKFVNKFLLKRRDEFLEKNIYSNYKSELLEYSQSKGWGIPKYRTVGETGPDHDKKFVVLVSVNKLWQGKGKGRNKKQAEQIAAKNVLSKIEMDDCPD
jgi:ribonuclease-3